MYLGHCILTSVFLVKAVLYPRYLLLFLTSASALLLASPSSAGKIIKNSSRSHNLLLSYESRMWPSIFRRRNLSHNWKSSSPGRREPENVVIYPISSVFLNQEESLAMPLKATLPFVEEKLSKGESFLKDTLTGNSCRCTWCILVSVVPSGRKTALYFFVVTMSFLNLKRKIIILFSWVTWSKECFVLPQEDEF